MDDNFGWSADAVEGAAVTYLKSARSFGSWEVGQIQLERTVLQFGTNGGAGLSHGITVPDRTTLLMQLTDFEDRVWLDGVLCPSSVLVIFPPGCHFSFVWSGPIKWVSWSIPENDNFALKAAPRTTTPFSLKTDKTIAILSGEAVARLRSDVREIVSQGVTAAATITEDALLGALESAWDRRLDSWHLPTRETRSAEQVVFHALHSVQSKPDAKVEIGDLVRMEKRGYRTFLRAFRRYLQFSPKRYLKIRQINAVYHDIRKGNGKSGLSGILSNHGVSEFGRFATEYKSIFAELPSETYRRHHDVCAT